MSAIKIEIEIYNKDSLERSESLGIPCKDTSYSIFNIRPELIEGFWISSNQKDITFYACNTSFVCKNMPENIHKLTTAMQ